MTSPTSSLPFHHPRLLDLSGDTLILESSKDLPRSPNLPSRYATLLDPVGATFDITLFFIVGSVAFRSHANVGHHN